MRADVARVEDRVKVVLNLSECEHEVLTREGYVFVPKRAVLIYERNRDGRVPDRHRVYLYGPLASENPWEGYAEFTTLSAIGTPWERLLEQFEDL